MKEINVDGENESLLKSALSKTEQLPKCQGNPQVFRHQNPDLKAWKGDRG